MNLFDVVRRSHPLVPWAEGDNIPWHDPAFSERMLKEHLRQDHDLASRRATIIEQHVAWVHRDLLEGRASRVLDLGCGPGLYAGLLARLGHECVGVDYSPASLAHATSEAGREGLRCTYIAGDLRDVSWGSDFDLVMMIFGEFNVFRPQHARSILARAREALVDGGVLLLEVERAEAIEHEGRREPHWSAHEQGPFSDRPHLLLTEHTWDAAGHAAAVRYFVVDAATGETTAHVAAARAYTDDEYRGLLAGAGFESVELLGPLGGVSDGSENFFAIVARIATDV